MNQEQQAEDTGKEEEKSPPKKPVPLYDLEGMKRLSTKDKMEWSYYLAHLNSI